uniref:Uncharacterized protein n=1 Tax=Aegilops tauschii subsp. strangulata TaxID=200361 RepID=A0A453IAW1_AEGTS
ETLDFKLLLKPKADSSECIVEEGPNRPLGCGSNQVEMTDAVFKLAEKDSLECKVWVETEMLSPFDLAASWKAHQENLQPSRVRGTYDVVMNTETEARDENDFASGLELDLEKYVVPTTPNMGSGVVYAANLTENPRSLLDTGISPNNLIKGDAPLNHYANTKKV